MSTKKDDDDAETPETIDNQRPEDPPDPEDPPTNTAPFITSVSPIAGAMAGGIVVTLTGSRFQPDAEVYFGSIASPEVTYESPNKVLAKLPPATDAGSVTVSLVNPDGRMATRPGGFTYISTEPGEQAVVLGLTPLSVIEDTETEVVLRGFNLIAAYTDGMVALRAPDRVNLTTLSAETSHDQETGIESLTFTVRITATPPLEPLERVVIQVLVSRRSEAWNDGIVESSSNMFAVLPQAIPVVLARTDNLVPNRPNLVVIAGKNLEGCTLRFGKGVTVHHQRSDEATLVGVVTVPEAGVRSATAELNIVSNTGIEVAQYSMTIGATVVPELPNTPETIELESRDAKEKEAQSFEPDEEVLTNRVETIEEGFGLILTPVPDQQLITPTESNSVVFNLGEQASLASSSFSFNFSNFSFTIFRRTFVFNIINEVRLIPFFDGGDTLSSPVLAEVGKLFRVRGMGLIIALRVQLVVRITVVIIIGYNVYFGPWGLYNEFYNEYPWGMGSIVISIEIYVDIILRIMAMIALVEPGGRLRVLFSFNLTLGIHFQITADGQHLQFDPRFTHKVRYTSIIPQLNNLLPCDGRFQLAEENGQTVFPDSFGGQQSFYFARAEGVCCVPWDFDLKLIRFAPNGPEETLQESFRANFCVNAAPPASLMNIIITSEHPEPQPGLPPRLVMTFDDLAFIKALAQPVDAAGNPTGAPMQDVRDLGYDVEFYLETTGPEVLDPTALPEGDAAPVLPGDNFIHARIWSRTRDVRLFSVWPGSISGFVITRFLNAGLLPGILGGTLPVTVNPLAGSISVETTVAYRNDQNQIVPTASLERLEPFETPGPAPRYFLAARISIAPDLNARQKLTFTVLSAQFAQLPLAISNVTFADNRGSVSTPTRFFTGMLAKDGESVVHSAGRRSGPVDWTEIVGLNIEPNRAEDASLAKLVPPGTLVGGRDVELTVMLNVTSNSGAQVRHVRPELKLTVHNNETFEEYLRVFREVPEIMADPNPPAPNATLTQLREFAKTFYTELNTRPVTVPPTAPAAPTAAKLKEKGELLWNLGVTLVKTGPKDDRALYWARLQAIAALRLYYQRNNLSGLNQAVIDQFEWPSRGLEQSDGSISFAGAPAGARRAIVTGFDPFGLPSRVKKSNPSGLIALSLNKETINSAEGAAYVRTAVFPVRYKDFDTGLVERAVRPNINSIALLVTCSEGDTNYDVERFAGKNRGHVMPDNQGKFNTGNPAPHIPPTIPDITVPPGVDPGKPQFIESTLPYERVITVDTRERQLPGPQPMPPVGMPFSNDRGFVLNQYFVAFNSDTSATEEFPQTTDEIDPNSYLRRPNRPSPTADSIEGSGSNFLSNEIFYRTALMRSEIRPALPSGHLHVPVLVLATDPRTHGAAMLSAAKTAVTRFLGDKLELRSLNDVTFPDTGVNRTSAPLALTAKNETGAVVDVPVVEIDPPAGFALQTALPAHAAANAIFSLSFTFSPTQERVYESMVRVRRSAGGEILFSAPLKGKGVALPPAPVITGFTPTTGRMGDDVIISGSNLDGATEVRIGTVAISFTADTAQIVGIVSGPPRLGKITVVTPSGTAVSAASFRVLNIIHPPPEEKTEQ
jgi:pyrrolidone-carboxylate peptidase